MLLRDKVAIIYGAGGAVGGATARAFAREGAMVYLAGRTPAALEAVAGDIAAAGGKARVSPVDAFDIEAVRRQAEAIAGEAGRIDISFNLIGMGDAQGARLTAMAEEHFHMPIANAMRGHFNTTTACAPTCRRAG